jgi:hypothetical protein
MFSLFFILSVAGLLSLYIEFDYRLFNLYIELYPGLFQWSLYFSLVSCVVLSIMTKSILSFIFNNIKRWKLGIICYILPVFIYTFGMSYYEWNAPKFAVYEMSPSISAATNNYTVDLVQQLGILDAKFDNFDDYALSVKNKPRKNAYVKQCKFNGKDRVDYETKECYCTISDKKQQGDYCEKLKDAWYRSLKYHIGQKHNRSYTYYFSRISFSALVIIFSFGLMNAVFLVLLGDYIKQINVISYKKSLFFIQLFSIFSIIWWIMRFYFVEMQSLIFPITQNSILANRAMLYMVLAPVIIGFIYSFGANIKIVKSVLEDFTLPLLAILAALLGLAQKEMAMYVFGIFFGVESNFTYRVIFITLTCALLVPPFYKYLREEGVFEFNR